MSALPQPRGPVSEALFAGLRTRRTRSNRRAGEIDAEDLHLALYCCYELHYRGFEGVETGGSGSRRCWRFRGELERRFEADGARARRPAGRAAGPARDGRAAARADAADDAPSVSTFVEREATPEQVLEFVIHRSAYQLKEADPHSWAIPRLSGAPKAALIEIQADEYGGGRAARMHAALFAATMDALGLDRRYGAYLDRIPGVTLATVNLMSLFGLHRRRRGAIVGHLALFEMTSSVPNRRYAQRLAPAGPRRGRRPRSSTCTWSPTPCTRASPPSTSRAAWRSRTRGSAPTSCGAPARCWRSRALGRHMHVRVGEPARRRCAPRGPALA